MGGVPREHAPYLPSIPGCALSSVQNHASLTGPWHCQPLPPAFQSWSDHFRHESTAFKLHTRHEWSEQAAAYCCES